MYCKSILTQKFQGKLQKQFITIKSYLFTMKAYFVQIKQGKEKINM